MQIDPIGTFNVTRLCIPHLWKWDAAKPISGKMLSIDNDVQAAS